jgi:hypothetical protein
MQFFFIYHFILIQSIQERTHSKASSRKKTQQPKQQFPQQKHLTPDDGHIGRNMY